MKRRLFTAAAAAMIVTPIGMLLYDLIAQTPRFYIFFDLAEMYGPDKYWSNPEKLDWVAVAAGFGCLLGGLMLLFTAHRTSPNR